MGVVGPRGTDGPAWQTDLIGSVVAVAVVALAAAMLVVFPVVAVVGIAAMGGGPTYMAGNAGGVAGSGRVVTPPLPGVAGSRWCGLERSRGGAAPVVQMVERRGGGLLGDTWVP